MLAEPYRLGASDAHATASIGISLYSPEIETPAQMLEQADRALYQAKHLGRDQYCFHSPRLEGVG
jgi:diguanylate cyclase (GGDEF)-like protein